MEGMEEVKHILERIYGGREGGLAFRKIVPLIEESSVKRIKKKEYFSEKLPEIDFAEARPSGNTISKLKLLESKFTYNTNIPNEDK